MKLSVFQGPTANQRLSPRIPVPAAFNLNLQAVRSIIGGGILQVTKNIMPCQ